jgi:hypothetical protein
VPNLSFAPPGGAGVKNRFRLFNIKLPAVQASATTLQRQILPSATVQPHAAILQTGQPPASGSQTSQPLLFQAASNSAADLASQKAMNDLYAALIQQIVAAIEFGFNFYRQSAGLVDVVINGPQASGGRLQGQALDRFIMTAPSVTGWSGSSVPLRDAVAKGLNQQWTMLAASVRVPDLRWYPQFAAIPAPFAPPTPNAPTLFSALTYDANTIAPFVVKAAMQSSLRGKFDYSDQLFESIATGFESAFKNWKGSQMIRGVLGTGPVPNFAPPYIPVGVVVGGKVLPGMHLNT